MDPYIQVSKPQICHKHNQPILLYDLDPNKEASCLICMSEKTGMVCAESYLLKLNIFIKQKIDLCKNNIQLFQDCHQSILNHKNCLIVNLDKILQMITDQIQNIRTNQKNLEQLTQSNEDYQKTIHDLQMKSQNLQKENNQVNAKVKQQLLDFYKNYLKDVKVLLYDVCQLPKKSIEVGEGRFKYELIKQAQWKEENICYAFAFNKESNILVVACEKQIIVYQFNEGGIVKELQRLIEHSKYVYCLYFMKQSNSFVSGSQDQYIIIWEYDKIRSQWFARNQLKDHKKSIQCVTMNKSEDLLISGSIDKTIKFWNRINSRWTIQQTIVANECVYEISLNEKESRLISCVEQQIQILKKDIHKKWRIIQTIHSDGHRLCFSVGYQFVFQPYESDRMEVYDYNLVNKQFKKVQDVQILKQNLDLTGFVCQYIQKLNIVALKRNIYLNIFQISSVGKYKLLQTIIFKSDFIFGKLSEDGKYLVTWDRGSMQIQVRSLLQNYNNNNDIQ